MPMCLDPPITSPPWGLVHEGMQVALCGQTMPTMCLDPPISSPGLWGRTRQIMDKSWYTCRLGRGKVGKRGEKDPVAQSNEGHRSDPLSTVPDRQQSRRPELKGNTEPVIGKPPPADRSPGYPVPGLNCSSSISSASRLMPPRSLSLRRRSIGPQNIGSEIPEARRDA
jgi:hypothetical protein